MNELAKMELVEQNLSIYVSLLVYRYFNGVFIAWMQDGLASTIGSSKHRAVAEH